MPAVVERVEFESIAYDLEIKKGDIVEKINDVVPSDLLQYRQLTEGEEIELQILRTNGEVEVIEIEKDFYDDLGIIFENAIFDRIKPCANNCIFCFVDQQPEGLRESLYVKDDDYRLSYLQGTYITLTNLTKKDKERIQNEYLAPLYVSVHTTNPQLRSTMLRNKRAANIMDDLLWFQENNIPLHLQIVLCPDYNDGDELERTLRDFEKIQDIILSVAVVPVGVTKFRTPELKRVDSKCAQDVIKRIADFNKRVGRNLACASDEFFLITNKKIPSAKYYGEFGQLEDGVGALRLLLDDFKKNKKNLPTSLSTPLKMHLCTSVANEQIFSEINCELKKIENLTTYLTIIKSNFFGANITVAGLITAKDIIQQLKHKKDEIDLLVIPSVMLRPSTELFLDGLSLSDVECELECKIFVIQNIYSTKEMIDLISTYK